MYGVVTSRAHVITLKSMGAAIARDILRLEDPTGAPQQRTAPPAFFAVDPAMEMFPLEWLKLSLTEIAPAGAKGI